MVELETGTAGVPLPDDDPGVDVGVPVWLPVDEVVPDEPKPPVVEVLPPASVPLPVVGEPLVPVPSPVAPTGSTLPEAPVVPPVRPEPSPVPPVASAPPLDNIPVLAAPPVALCAADLELPVAPVDFEDNVAAACTVRAETEGELVAGTEAAVPPAALALAPAGRTTAPLGGASRSALAACVRAG